MDPERLQPPNPSMLLSTLYAEADQRINTEAEAAGLSPQGRRNRLERYVGDGLSLTLDAAQTAPHFRAATEVLSMWLPPHLTKPSTANTDDVETRFGDEEPLWIPCTELAESLFKGLLRIDWHSDSEALAGVMQNLGPVFKPPGTPNRAGFIFFGSIYTRAHNLSEIEEGDPLTTQKLSVLSAMTDNSIMAESVMDENVWGRAGIRRLSPATALAVTAETHRRFVIEKQPIYVPRDERELVATIGKYCLAVIQQIGNDPSRRSATNPSHNQNINNIVSFVTAQQRRQVGIPFDVIARVANAITTQANNHGGLSDPTGRRRPHELLPENNRAVTGEALRRILGITRQIKHHDYRDGLHVGIVHELAVIDTRQPKGQATQT